MKYYMSEPYPVSPDKPSNLLHQNDSVTQAVMSTSSLSEDRLIKDLSDGFEEDGGESSCAQDRQTNRQIVSGIAECCH